MCGARHNLKIHDSSEYENIINKQKNETIVKPKIYMLIWLDELNNDASTS